MMEKNIGTKEKRTNKGTDKQYVADSLIHYKTYHTRCLYQILGQVVAEKSLTKKKIYTHTHKHTHKRKKQKLYTPYILRIPGV